MVNSAQAMINAPNASDSAEVMINASGRRWPAQLDPLRLLGPLRRLTRRRATRQQSLRRLVNITNCAQRSTAPATATAHFPRKDMFARIAV